MKSYPKPITRRAFAGMLLVVSSGAAIGAGAPPDAQTILVASDAVRNPARPFAVVLTLIEYRNRKQTDTNTLQVYSKADGVNTRSRFCNLNHLR